MPDSPKLESFLAADIGTLTTKVGLVDRVGDEFRFVSAASSATTAEPPTADLLVGLRRAIEIIETRTGRHFISDEGQLITPERGAGQGVDAFAAITSAPAPLRVAIVGVSREVSLASAARAVNGTYATVEATLALDQTGGRWLPVKPQASADGADKKAAAAPLQDPAVIAAETLARANPDVIVLVGGVDGGATTPLYDIANLVTTIVTSRDEGTRPIVIFAGNRDARSQIAARVGQVAPFRAVDNVRPALEVENPFALQRELEAIYIERKVAWLPGLNALTSWTPVAVMPSARALENLVRFVARRFDLNVLGADLGGTSTCLALMRGGSFARVVRSDLGLGANSENLITHGGLERLTSWLPLEMDAEDARTRWLNHALHPGAIPVAREDARLMQSAARAALSMAAREGAVDASGINLILLTGGVFAYSANPAALALLALDALQPSGIFTLAVDPLGLAPAFAALASVNPQAAASAIEHDGFVTLGTVIAPVARTREGQIDLRVQIHSESSGTVDLEVPHGTLELVPLPPGQKASIQVRPARGVDLGKKHSGVFQAQVEGGTVGLIIDARGRPITLPGDADKRRAKVQQWYWDIGGEVSYG
ncbi:MAG: glutamate mutase L [Chloroflexota bacterium]|nr:glutamate mutase L [Chloroflexota bacterium]